MPSQPRLPAVPLAAMAALGGLLCSLAATWAASAPAGADAGAVAAQPPKEEIAEFIGVLVKKPALPDNSDRGRSAYVLGFDAHWVVLFRVEKLIRGGKPFVAGKEQAFLVNSPALLFRSVPAEPKARYRVQVHLERDANGVTVKWLEVDAAEGK